MFGGSRRRRPPVAPLNSSTADPNATTAATSAFMSAVNQNPNKTLSSAAAAAALRARPHTPTNVAQVQTKRTARRSASVSSSGSARLANGHGQLERRGSTSSMTERTFRSPSPHRALSTSTHEQQPPVPRIPDTHRTSAPNVKNMGVAMQNFRTASQKMADEPPSWYLRPTGDISNVRTSDSAMAIANSTPPRNSSTANSQPIRSDSRSSVNFSYPTTFRPQSPPASPTQPSVPDLKLVPLHPSGSASNPSKGPLPKTRPETGQQLVYDPNSRRMVPQAPAGDGSAYQVKQIAEKPQKRRRDGPLRREGSQLAKGTVTRARGSMVDENKSLREMSKQEEKQEELTARALPTTEKHFEAQHSDIKSTGVESTDHKGSSPPPESSGSTPQHLSLSTQKADQQLQDVSLTGHSKQIPISTAQDKSPISDKRPAVEEHQVQPSQTVRDALDSMPTQQLSLEALSPLQSSEKVDRQESIPEPRPLTTIVEPKLPEVNSEQKMIVAENRPVVELSIETSHLTRSSSNSPARQARFAPRPSEQLAVRHAPLPRSASPIKSAMKQTSPVLRGVSPSDNTSDPSRAGTVSLDRNEEPVVSRKKSVRVSFDDQGPVVVGDSAAAAEEDTLITQSPSGSKRAWFSNIGRSKKKDIALDDDEIMKPRPALPSFGSIREKKNRELGERPLVRPLEPAHSPARSPSPELRPQSSSTLNDSEFTEDSVLGQSSDNALGSLLAHDQTSRNAANISRFREPLPPVVTSIEGSGYSSDSMQGSDNEDHPDSTTGHGISSINSTSSDPPLKQSDKDNSNRHTQTTSNIHTKDEQPPETPTTQQKDIPEISVIQPSPMSVDHGSLANDSSTPFFDVPGGFPDYGSDASAGSQIEASRETARVAIMEPTATTVPSDRARHLPQTALETARPVATFDNEDESDESVYSDAYEDIPDLDSGGFMSLDAIVESHHTAESKNSSSPISRSSLVPVAVGKPERDAVTEASLASQTEPTPPGGADDWEQAKAFWRSLTAEKRRQLELEAAEEAGVDGDREEASQPIRRNSSRRKSSEVTQSPIKTFPAQVNPIQPESRMRMSLRKGQATKTASTEPRPSMRKSLRSNGGTQTIAKPSPREAGPNILPKSSTSSRHEATKARARSSTQPTSNSGISTQIKPTLQRRGSDASDSSFKRNRPSPGGGFAFRKTMRQSSPAQPRHEPTGGSGRFSLRSLSPTGSATRPGSNASFTTSSPGVLKRTLRSNSESSHESKRSSVHFPLFTRSGKSASKSSKYTSRFEDSSDEDEGTFTGFRSRIDDSSDDEKDHPPSTKESKALGKGTLRSSATAPSFSRPAPVPELEEDSPELPDSDDDMPSPLRSPQSRVAASHVANHMGERRDSGAIGTSTLSRSRSGRGGFTPSLTSPAPPAKRGSLLGRLRLNKRADQGGKIQRAELVDSAARRDTRLERDQGQLKGLRSDQPSSPKLHKRTFISRHEGKTLQRPTSAGDLLGRATTSTVERPNLDGKRSLSLNLGTTPNPNLNQESHEFESASVDSSGVQVKKKKFGALRRMFKLDE